MELNRENSFKNRSGSKDRTQTKSDRDGRKHNSTNSAIRVFISYDTNENDHQ